MMVINYNQFKYKYVHINLGSNPKNEDLIEFNCDNLSSCTDDSEFENSEKLIKRKKIIKIIMIILNNIFTKISIFYNQII